MKFKKTFFRVLTFFFSLVLTACAQKPQITKNDFDINGQSHLYVKNATNDSLNIKISNWFLLPWEEQKFDTTISPNSSIKFTIKTQGKSYYDVKLGTQDLKIFTYPNVTDSIKFLPQKEVAFSGDLKPINNYLHSKSKFFSLVEAEYKDRINITRSDDIQKIINFNDSITQIHLNYLKKTSFSLPKWYTNYEFKRLLYLNAGWKFNLFQYRKYLNKKDILPADFVETTIKGIDIQDESMIGDFRYSLFISNYIWFKIDPKLKSEIPKTNDEWDLHFSKLIASTDKELIGLTRDFQLAWLICTILESHKYLFKEEWLELIQDKDLKTFTLKQIESKPILPTGTPVPYFYLRDEKGNFHQHSNYKGKIVYLSFWAAWCKSCIIQFPDENNLVTKFKDKAVTFINICIESDTVKWKEMIQKHNLKTINLIAVGAWNDKLKRDFDIHGIPHAVLIDQEGKIIENKTLRASQIEAKILKLLEKK